MKKIKCKLCGGEQMRSKNGSFECQDCGTIYSLEEVKEMMVEVEEGTTNSSGVNIENEAQVLEETEELIENAEIINELKEECEEQNQEEELNEKVVVCEACGAKIKKGDKFCSNCGMRVTINSVNKVVEFEGNVNKNAATKKNDEGKVEVRKTETKVKEEFTNTYNKEEALEVVKSQFANVFKDETKENIRFKGLALMLLGIQIINMFDFYVDTRGLTIIGFIIGIIGFYMMFK